jgi:hypothetical protein
LLGNGDGTFQAGVAYDSGLGPSSVAVADFNGDGKADLAVTDAGPFVTGAAGFVSILLGNGNGTFQAARDYAAGNAPNSVANADLNGDGKPELVVADGARLWVLLGNGDGTFESPVSDAAGGSAVLVTIGDFNNDGKKDLVAADSSGGIGVLLGNGNGAFQTAVNYPTATGASAIAAADLNGDGKLDLIVANSTGNYVSVLLGNGNGTFQTAVNNPAGTAPHSVAIGDLNGDGKPDLAVAASGGPGSDAALVLLSNGNGTFQMAVPYGADALPQAIAVGDFNGDGKADLAVANYFSSDASILLGNGNGTFQPAVNYAVGNTPFSLAVSDFAGDSKADLAVVNRSDLTVFLSLRAAPDDHEVALRQLRAGQDWGNVCRHREQCGIGKSDGRDGHSHRNSSDRADAGIDEWHRMKLQWGHMLAQ